METLLLLARLVLSAVFAVAGISKLADLSASRQAIEGFGVPERFAKALGWLLPVAEIATAVTLLFVESVWFASLAALALLSLFIIAISVSLARGRKPDCNCFGQVHSAPISWSLVIRNLVFSALALFIALQGKAHAGTDIFQWLGLSTLADKINLFTSLAVVILLGVIAIFLSQLLKQQQEILRRLEALNDDSLSDGTLEIVTHQDLKAPAQGLPIGAPAPEFSLPSIEAEEIALQDLLDQGKPLMLFFVAPSCSPCTALMPEVEYWQHRLSDQLTFVIISKGSIEENQEKFDNHAIPYILLQNESEVADLYSVPWTPGAILVKSDGAIASEVAYGSEQIKNLFAYVASLNQTRPWFSKSLATQAEGTKPAIGDQAPSLMLADLSGNPLALADFFKEKTLLLFWNPDCGFCQAMLDEVKELQARRANGTPKIVIVSRGTAEEILHQGLQSPILLDDEFKAGKAFGASGTPSAILIDAQGRIASSLGTGEAEVLALAGFHQMQSAGSS